MKVRAVAKTHIGKKRKLNEDSYLVSEELGLFIIADGMGGHKSGEVASRMVVDTMADYWQKWRNNNPPSFIAPIEQDLPKTAKHLLNSIAFANSIVHEAQKKPEYHQMGSTISAILVDDDCLWLANVGDSPAYLYDHGHLILISEEHSVEAEQKSLGLYDVSGPGNPLIKNVLTRVLGLNEKVDVFITPIRPDAGDIIVMCSDGLTNELSDRDIKMILDDTSTLFEQKVNILVEEANRSGGKDNISVILLKVLDEGRWERIKRKLKL
ncbi:MAG: serine/threonine-protein phosphatase [Deltaproteobacteria bacterium]|nr:serine/threonine-protein phosphatase [Deltaproteobacteria bacterium]